MSKVEEVPQIENNPLVCDKATETETAIDGFDIYNPAERFMNIFGQSLKMSLTKKFFLQLLKMSLESWQV